MLTIDNLKYIKISAQMKAPSDKLRDNPCLLANSKNNTVMAISGRGHRSISRYSFRKNQWKSGVVPDLNEARVNASACMNAEFIFVIGGQDDDSNFLSSIERIERVGLSRS